MTAPVLLPIHMVLLKSLMSLMHEYGRASGARLNTTKSKGLWLGRWRSCTDSPCGLTCVNTSLKIVGIYFGSENAKIQLWEPGPPEPRRQRGQWPLLP